MHAGILFHKLGWTIEFALCCALDISQHTCAVICSHHPPSLLGATFCDAVPLQKHLHMELKESWYEKLCRWDEALEAYERRCELLVPIQTLSVPGWELPDIIVHWCDTDHQCITCLPCPSGSLWAHHMSAGCVVHAQRTVVQLILTSSTSALPST